MKTWSTPFYAALSRGNKPTVADLVEDMQMIPPNDAEVAEKPVQVEDMPQQPIKRRRVADILPG